MGWLPGAVSSSKAFGLVTKKSVYAIQGAASGLDRGDEQMANSADIVGGSG